MDGRNRRGVVDPLGGRLVDTSSSCNEGHAAPADEDPFCDLLSVEDVPWLPLRFLFMYFSIASASLSRTRVANGDRADMVPLVCCGVW